MQCDGPKYLGILRQPVRLKKLPTGLRLGDKIRLIPGDCDPAVNLYDWYVCIRNNRVDPKPPITVHQLLPKSLSNFGEDFMIHPE